MVAVDFLLYFRNKRLDKIAEKSGDAVKKTLEGYEHLRESENSLNLLKELIEKFDV